MDHCRGHKYPKVVNILRNLEFNCSCSFSETDVYYYFLQSTNVDIIASIFDSAEVKFISK